jgi:hypothetical protein
MKSTFLTLSIDDTNEKNDGVNGCLTTTMNSMTETPDVLDRVMGLDRAIARIRWLQCAAGTHGKEFIVD